MRTTHIMVHKNVKIWHRGTNYGATPLYDILITYLLITLALISKKFDTLFHNIIS
jgi:hypothetical protein